MIQPGLVARRLGNRGEYEDDLIGATRSHVRYILLVYAILTGIGIVVLMALGTGFWNGMLYTFAAVSTGGFAPYDGSLAALKGLAPQVAVILLSVAGGISFIFYRRNLREGWKVMLHDRQTQMFLLAAVVTAALLALLLRFQNGLLWPDALRHGFLNGFSAQSTAGFASLNLAQIDPGSKLILIFSMLCGGCVGSTAGGIKIMRLMIFFRVFYLVILKAGLSRHAVADIQLEKRRLNSDEIQNTFTLILLFVFLTGLSWLPFVLMGHNPLDALFEVVSAIGTVGLSAGTTGPDLHPFLKGVLCFNMLLGRLEILVWLVLLTPRTWLGRRWEE
jgi:trk system potassium uptake protein TrkH